MHVSDQKDGNCWPLLSLAQTVVWQDQERSSLTRRCSPFSACSWLHVLGREKGRPARGRAPAFSGVCTGQHQGNQHITTESVAETTTLDKNPFSFLRFHHIPSSYCSDPSFHNTHLYIFHPNHIKLVLKDQTSWATTWPLYLPFLTLEKCAVGNVQMTTATTKLME